LPSSRVGRRCDYQPQISEARSTGQRGLWLLAVALAGIVLWLFAQVDCRWVVGSIEAWPWLIALIAIGACWWQIDECAACIWRCTLSDAAVLLIIALIVGLGCWPQIGQIPEACGVTKARFSSLRAMRRAARLFLIVWASTYNEPPSHRPFSWFISCSALT
jgi:cytochrome bd-type quinol oxidase subunit 2